MRDSATDAAILLLATARHDLLESHPDWGKKRNETKLVVSSLDDAAAAEVIANVVGDDLPAGVASRLVEAAGGNPLYVEQMLSMLIDSRALHLEDGRWICTNDAAEIPIPPTIHALLEARVDQLPVDVRATVEAAPKRPHALRAPHRARRGIVGTGCLCRSA